jgi:hypothetical protein
VSERYLIDKSALARWHRPAVAKVLDPLDERGLLWWLSGFEYLRCPDEVWDAALETQREATERGTTGHCPWQIC